MTQHLLLGLVCNNNFYIGNLRGDYVFEKMDRIGGNKNEMEISRN